MGRSAALEVYNKKRNFEQTAEPKGKAGKSTNKLRFVIQKHHARRLHFDFRLELDGVLKSWAIPKGPSLDPGTKRLAVRTEDHPVSYSTFEGSIPVGQYGGGTVLLWDEGYWKPIGDPRDGLEKGALKFELHGLRLQGGYALISLRNDPKGRRDNWLLVKEKDRHAKSSRDAAEKWTTSISSGRSLAEIASGDPARSPGKKKLSKNELPKFIAPQLATLVKEPPNGADWVHEIKYDGYRAIAAVGSSRCRIFTRSGRDWSHRFSQVAKALSTLNISSALLDGEIVALDGEGKSDFALLQQHLKKGEGVLDYVAFDLLKINGRDLRREPLTRRKDLLRNMLTDPPPGIRYSDHIVGHGPDFFEKACAARLEGIISKRATSSYVSRRTKSWLKTKCSGNDEFVVGGYRAPRTKGRPFASLLLGRFDGDRLHYKGRVGTGFDQRDFDDLALRLDQLARPTNPFVDVPSDVIQDARWLEPRLIAQISYAQETKDGYLRHPSFLGLREVKSPKDVQLQTMASASKKIRQPRVTGVRLTSPEKVLFPEAKVTKEDLANFFVGVSERLLPHVCDRPLSFVRCPEGADEKCFFQKHRARGMPRAIKSVALKEKDGEPARYVMINDTAGLVAAAQLSVLELHIWGSHAKTIENPDRLVFDLDPGPGTTFEDVRGAATDIRDLLQAAELESFALLTGGKGIHVVVPLEPEATWDEVKTFAKGVANALADNDPTRFTATMAKAKRGGRIFIDWLRNERGATAIAPYSPRANATASVATPVSWNELARIESAHEFAIPDVLKRLDRLKAEPWPDYFAVRQTIGKKALAFFASTRDRRGRTSQK